MRIYPVLKFWGVPEEFKMTLILQHMAAESMSYTASALILVYLSSSSPPPLGLDPTPSRFQLFRPLF